MESIHKEEEKLNCPLCDHASFPFYITFCWSHTGQALIVSTTHKAEFSDREKELIRRMFPQRSIRWEKQSIFNHAHVHII